MQGSTSSSPPGYTTNEIRRYVGALPAMGEAPALNERAAQAARSVLGRANPSWEQSLRVQIDAIATEVAHHLDHDPKSGRYAITATELRGIIASAVSRSSSQCVVDIGRTLVDTEPMDSQLETAFSSSDTRTTRPYGLDPQQES